MWQKIKNIYHLFQAIIANILYGFPARKIIVIGVTGTDGKTTTTSLIYHILKTAGEKVSMITSIGAYIGDKQYDIGFHVTTPSSFGLQKYIRRIVDEGNEYLVLETTSHALDQNRVWGIPYTIGVLTNITHEHLDYHKTYTSYVMIKYLLLRKAEISILNRDDKSWSILEPLVKSRLSLVFKAKPLTYSLDKQEADYTPKKYPFKTDLLGDFNISNCLAAIAAAKALGISDVYIRNAIASFTAPVGRQEIVYDKDFRVMIDFAHTPNGFAQILPAVKKITNGRLIHVFGSAGRRDKSKRPFMGKESAKYADIIVLTAEDPRDESVGQINSEIKSGITGFTIYPSVKLRASDLRFKNNEEIKKGLFTIPDRKEAIEFAIRLAQKGDTVLLTGKSHEKSINYGHGEEPWDEFEEVREAIDKKHKKL